MAKAAKEEGVKPLSERIKDLSVISLNSANYLGKSEKIEGGIVISDAIEIGELDFEDSVKKWIKDENLGSLETFTVEGSNIALAKKSFNNDQLYMIDLVAATATYKMSRAVKDLENNSF